MPGCTYTEPKYLIRCWFEHRVTQMMLKRVILYKPHTANAPVLLSEKISFMRFAETKCGEVVFVPFEKYLNS